MSAAGPHVRRRAGRGRPAGPAGLRDDGTID